MLPKFVSGTSGERTMWTEITKEAFWLLIGNDEISWRDYKQTELAETSYYYNNGVALQATCNFISNVTQYYVQDINY